MTSLSILANEHISSIRDIQKHPSRALRGITRVMRGSKTMGFFFSNEHFEDLMESIEALSSKNYLARIAKARRSKSKGIPLAKLAAKYGL